MTLVQSGAELASFERLVGPVQQIEAEWHAYVRQLKTDPVNHDKRRRPLPR